jgi:hypothetical protein
MTAMMALSFFFLKHPLLFGLGAERMVIDTERLAGFMIFSWHFQLCLPAHTCDESHDCHRDHQSSCSLEERVQTAPDDDDDDVNKKGRIGTAVFINDNLGPGFLVPTSQNHLFA